MIYDLYQQFERKIFYVTFFSFCSGSICRSTCPSLWWYSNNRRKDFDYRFLKEVVSDVSDASVEDSLVVSDVVSMDSVTVDSTAVVDASQTDASVVVDASVADDSTALDSSSDHWL